MSVTRSNVPISTRSPTATSVGAPRPGAPTVFRPPSSVSMPRSPVITSSTRTSPTARGTLPSPLPPRFPPGTQVTPGPQPGTVTIHEPGRMPVVARDPHVQGPPREPVKKKKKWGGRIAIIIVVILVLVGVFLLLFFLVFTDGDGGDGNGNGNGGQVVIPEDAPFQDYGGSIGLCSVDTDCPIVDINVKGVLTPFTQYCVNPQDPSGSTENKTGICVTNKVCTQTSDCYSIPGLNENPGCDLANGQPCNFTTGCAGGYCQRIRCQTSTQCGFWEACTINSPGSEEFGYCVPIGNECVSSQFSPGSISCWGGKFLCTASTGTQQIGYCTECISGSTADTCNISNNPDSGPGSICNTLNITTIPNTIPPATCQLIDNFKYSTCPDPTANTAGGSINTLTTCCSVGTTNNMCGKQCYDDYMCDDSCPFCVPNDSGVTVCSCLRMTPYQRFFSLAQSTYSCVNANGVTTIDNTIVTDPNSYVNPNTHACTVTPGSNVRCVFDYSTTGINGTANCSSSSPYCIVNSNTCSTEPDGSRCKGNAMDGWSCQTFSNGIWSNNPDYVCGMDGTCRQGKLQAGEDCFGQEDQCDTGLICTTQLNTTTDPNQSQYKICIPNGLAS